MKYEVLEESMPAAPQWMLTFSDLLTLLLAFFVMRFATVSVDRTKFSVGLEYFRAASVVRNEESARQASAPSVLVADLQTVLAERLGLPPLKSWPSRQAARGKGVTLRLTNDGAVVTFDGGLFAAGSAELTFKGAELLQTLGRALRARSATVELRTYASDYEVGTPGFGSPWELAAARTALEIRQIVDAGVEPSAISAALKARVSPDGAEGQPQVSEIILRVRTGDAASKL